MTDEASAAVDEIEEEYASEFGRGVVVCLAKFSEHLWNRRSPNLHEKPEPRLVEIYGSPEAWLSNEIEMWMNGASDHLSELDRAVAPPSLCELADLSLRVGHGFGHTDVWTMETVGQIRELWKRACIDLDRRLGVEADWGSW